MPDATQSGPLRRAAPPHCRGTANETGRPRNSTFRGLSIVPPAEVAPGYVQAATKYPTP